jgi:hypothetical protein
MASGLAARNGGRIGVATLVAVLLLGFGLRLGEAWDGRAPVFDATAYAAIAANLGEGEGFTAGPTATQPSSDYSPGLPLLVAALYKATGGVHERLARVLLAAIGTLSVLFAYLIARRLAAPLRRGCPSVRIASSKATSAGEVGGLAGAAGLLAALGVAVYPALLEYQGMLMTEPLAATLLAGAVLAVLWARDEDGIVRWALPGVLLGALALVRPEYLGVGVLVAALVLLSGLRDWRRALAAAAVVLTGLVVVVAPWTVRNAVAMHRLVPVSTGGGQVLFAGTYLPSDGDPEKVGAGVVAENPGLFGPEAVRNLRLEQILARLAADRHPGMEPDEALSKMGKEQLWDDVSEAPLEYLGFLAAKVGRIWSHGPRAVMREPLWEALHWALVALGALGLALLAWRRRWEALLLGTIFVAITAISALLVASPRRVLVMLPLIAALAGVGAAWLGAEALRLAPQRAAPRPPADSLGGP